MKPDRTILLLALTVWIAGWLRSTPPAGGHVRRSFGVLAAAVALMLLAGPAPKLAVGLAWIMALGLLIGEGESVAATLNRALGN